MATNLPYQDSVYHFRLKALIIDGGTEVLRNIFNNRLNNQPLVTFLSIERENIERLRRENTIKNDQYVTLFPPEGQNPDSKDFDMTLLICLLRNIPSLGLNMSYRWRRPPQQSDTSTEANLDRMRRFRNEIAHASSTHSLDEPTYNQQWDKVEQCLQGLNIGPHSDPHLQATINSLKTSPLDPAAEQRLDRQWQELENSVQSEINTIKEDISEVTGDVSKVQGDIVVVKGDVTKVKGDIGNLKQGIGKVEEDILVVTGDVGQNKEDICKMKGGIEQSEQRLDKQWQELENVMHSEINTIKEDISAATGDIDNLKRGNELMEERVNNLEEQAVKKPMNEDVMVEEKLQEDLIETYRSDHSEMNLTPLLNKGTPLLKFYQMPDLEHVTENIEVGRAVKEERTPIDTWEKLFHDSNQANPRSIYICADAGLGKTAFSKYLARAWCQSKKPLPKESEFFKPEQLKAIGKFRFVFLLFLRKSQKSNLCHLKDIIWEQLVSKLIRSYKIEDLENILRNEKCLVILDGLDEWTHPPTCGEIEQVPHWIKSENVAVITTTRPWKCNVAGLNFGQINHRIELTGLNENSAKKLKNSCLSYFKMQQLKVESLRQEDIDEVHSSVETFTKTVSDKHATQLESVPLMLMYMLFLYMYGINLGDTKCDLYCRIIELLLSRTFEDQQKTGTHEADKIPLCFNKLKHCSKFYNPNLKRLGKLAFKTLLEEKREENTLVFDSSVAIECLGEECFKQCLKTGIISQSKCVQTDPSIQESTVSFAHKTMQEFFAALNMNSGPDDESISKLVLSKCKNVQNILDISKIIMFISGMNVNVAALLSRRMMNIINEDEITQEYRNTTEIGSDGKPLKDLQNMFVSCCKEMPRASGHKFYIQDVFIDRDCKDEQYSENLKQLIQNKNHNIKSVYIRMSDMKDTPYNSVQKVVEYFELKDLKNIVKIFCVGGEDTYNIIPVLNTQVKCLQLGGGSCSRSLCEEVTSLHKLEAIYISWFTMSHNQLRLLYDFITQRVDMRMIELGSLDCSDHEESSCSGLSLDLSQHSQLRTLKLGFIPLSKLNINRTSLERYDIRYLSLISCVYTWNL